MTAAEAREVLAYADQTGNPHQLAGAQVHATLAVAEATERLAAAQETANLIAWQTGVALDLTRRAGPDAPHPPTATLLSVRGRIRAALGLDVPADS